MPPNPAGAQPEFSPAPDTVVSCFIFSLLLVREGQQEKDESISPEKQGLPACYSPRALAALSLAVY